ncbi:MAG: hypothetical protein WAU01_04640 [Saprospiraceae bacterium]
MSFAGHVLDMINRQKMNRALQRQAREKNSEKLDILKTDKSPLVFNDQKFSKKSPIDEARNAQKIRRQLQKESLIQWLKVLVTLIVAALFLYWLFWL